jgi:hypothetical protein
MKSQRLALALVASFALSSVACAGDAEPADDGSTLEMKPAGRPGEVTGSRVETLTATVRAIDHATRDVSLEGPSGNLESFKVGDEVRNLDQIQVGDKIVIEFLRGLMMQIQAPGEAPVTPSAEVAAGRAAVGATPGAAVGASIQATVTLTAIDMENRTVVFRGPGGDLYQVRAAPEVKLENAKVGQQFVATYTEAVVIQVEPAEKAGE